MPFAAYQFGEFTLDCNTFELCRKGRRLKLERKPLELLVLLVTKHGQVISRDEIARCLWAGEVFVDIEHGINTAIRKIRQTLGDKPDEPRFVQTISGSGYRFIAHVATVEPEAALHDQSLDASIELSSGSAGVDPEPVAEVPVAPAPRRRHWMIVALPVVAVAVTISILALERLPLSARLLHLDSVAPISSLAVLPFDNLSADPSQKYFADGMTDELTTELARIPNLRVISRTSVLADKGSRRSLPEVARQLDVDAIVEGSIVCSGDRVRITAQLIDARTDRHIWAQSFEGSASDVLSLQDSVARQIASQARLVLAPSMPHPPVNPAAFDAYLRGRYFFNKQDFTHSIESFQRAIELEPTYASAYAGYASALDAATTFGIGTPKQLMPKALAAAQRAIQLDSRNGEAYTELGSIQTIYEWDWTAAEQNLTRGISLDPSDAIAEFKYAVYLDAAGRPEDAVTHMRRALELDPLSFFINRRLGATLYMDRQYDEALVQLQRAAEMENQPGSIEDYVSLIYEQKGEHDEAVQHDLIALHVVQPQLDTEALHEVYKQHGWRSYWGARTGALLTTSDRPCAAYYIGIDDLRINQLDHAFDSFQHALDSRCIYMALIRVDPLFDSVRQNPHYTALLARMHQ